MFFRKIRHLVKCVPIDNQSGFIIDKYGGKDLEHTAAGNVRLNVVCMSLITLSSL